jgi:CBS domain-containing protein
MRSEHVGDLIVIEDDDTRIPIGLITDRDIVVEVIAAGLDPETVTVMDVVTEPLEVATEDTEFWDALAIMRKRGIRRLPVINDAGGLEGILTLDDALELIGEAVDNLVALVSREINQEWSARADD